MLKKSDAKIDLRVTELILLKNYNIHYYSSQYVSLSSGPEKVLALKSCVVLAQKWMQAAPEKVWLTFEINISNSDAQLHYESNLQQMQGFLLYYHY